MSEATDRHSRLCKNQPGKLTKLAGYEQSMVNLVEQKGRRKYFAAILVLHSYVNSHIKMYHLKQQPLYVLIILWINNFG